MKSLIQYIKEYFEEKTYPIWEMSNVSRVIRWGNR